MPGLLSLSRGRDLKKTGSSASQTATSSKTRVPLRAVCKRVSSSSTLEASSHKPAQHVSTRRKSDSDAFSSPCFPHNNLTKARPYLGHHFAQEQSAPGILLTRSIHPTTSLASPCVRGSLPLLSAASRSVFRPPAPPAVRLSRYLASKPARSPLFQHPDEHCASVVEIHARQCELHIAPCRLEAGEARRPEHEPSSLLHPPTPQ